MRLQRMRLPKKNVLKWLEENYGLGGMENYTSEQNEAILQAINLILKNAAAIEWDFLGKFFLKLSDSPAIAWNLLDELEKIGFEG